MSGEILFIGAIFLLGCMAFVMWYIIEYLGPETKTREYIGWYKIGRVLQLAKDKNIDIEELKVKDRLMRIKNTKTNAKFESNWTKRIEMKLADELDPIEEDNWMDIGKKK